MADEKIDIEALFRRVGADTVAEAGRQLKRDLAQTDPIERMMADVKLDEDVFSAFDAVPFRKGGKGANVPPGYVEVRGDGTFEAREHLKKLGAYWQPAPARRWVVPERNADRAYQLVKDARAGRLQAVVDTAPGSLTCFECGHKFNPATAEMQGGCADDFYCGCASRDDARRPRRAFSMPQTPRPRVDDDIPFDAAPARAWDPGLIFTNCLWTGV